MDSVDIARLFECLYLKTEDNKNYNKRLVIEKLQVKNFGANKDNRGLVATDSIPKDDIILSIPMECILTKETAVEECADLHNILSLHPRTLTCIEILVYFLFICQHIKPHLQCRWRQYFHTFPHKFHLAVHLSDIEIESLPTEKVKDDARIIQRKCSTMFHKFKLQWSEIANSEGNGNAEITFDNFRLCWSIVNTRCVYLDSSSLKTKSHKLFNQSDDDNCALIPFLDLLNHSPYAEVTYKINTVSNSFEIINLSGLIKAGEQVFLKYSSHDNYALLLEYGFILLDNPHHAACFDIDDIISVISDTPADYNVRMEYITHHSWHKNLFCTSDEGLSWCLEMTVAYMLYTGPSTSWCHVDAVLDSRWLDVISKVLDNKISSNINKMKTVEGSIVYELLSGDNEILEKSKHILL